MSPHSNPLSEGEGVSGIAGNKSGIDLLVPGLFGPMPALREIDVIPEAPAIEKYLARASVSDIPPGDYPSTLFHLFGLSDSNHSDLPTAPYCRLADGGASDNGYWLQASPVHLRPDGDGLLLFDAAHLEISLDEAKQLAESFRSHFADRGWEVELYSPQRWYLRLKQIPDLVTLPLTDVIGRNIHAFFPRSAESTDWEAVLNEVQMLFHMAPVNMLREGRGELSINGLWLHGGGSFHPLTETLYTAVSAAEPLVLGMALAAGIEPAALPRDGAELVSGSGRQLAVAHLLERPVLDADPYGWVAALERLDAWLEPLLQAVSAKRLGQINLYPCNGSVYRIDAAGLRRFWRGRRALERYLAS